MFPFAPSTKVMSPAFVPLLVFKIKSVVPPVVTVKVPAPLDVKVAAAAASPTLTVSPAKTTSPVPAGVTLISIFVSVPLVETEERVGPTPVAAFVILSSLTAVLAAPKTKASAPFASAIKPPSANFGAVKVLLVRVSVVAAPIKPVLTISVPL